MRLISSGLLLAYPAKCLSHGLVGKRQGAIYPLQKAYQYTRKASNECSLPFPNLFVRKDRTEKKYVLLEVTLWTFISWYPNCHHGHHWHGLFLTLGFLIYHTPSLPFHRQEQVTDDTILVHWDHIQWVQDWMTIYCSLNSQWLTPPSPHSPGKMPCPAGWPTDQQLTWHRPQDKEQPPPQTAES